MTKPPHNIELERALLGALLRNGDNAAWYECREVITEPRAFYNETARQLFGAIQRVAEGEQGVPGEPITLEVVLARLESSGDLPPSRADEILTHVVGKGIPANVPRYARQIRRFWVQRQGIALLAEKTAQLAGDVVCEEAILSRIAQEVQALIPGSRHKVKSFGELARDLHTSWEAQEDGEHETIISTGIPELNERIRGGLRKGELITVGAPTGAGKSTFARYLATYCSRPKVIGGQGAKVRYVTTEMAAAEVFVQSLGSWLKIPGSRLEKMDLSEFEMSLAYQALGASGDFALEIDDDPRASVSTVIARAKRQHATTGLDLLIVDYFQRLDLDGTSGKDSTESARYAAAAVALQQCARELEIPVVVLSQVVESVGREKRPASARDTAETRVLGKESHVFLGLHRPFYYYTDGDAAPKHHEGVWPPLATRLEVYVDHKRGCKAGRVSVQVDLACSWIAPIGARVQTGFGEDIYSEVG